MRKSVTVLALLVLLLGPAVAQGQGLWQPIGPEQARLIIAPSAFGTQQVRRQAILGVVRYEHASTRFDASRRFFSIVLREAPASVVVADSRNLQDTAREMIGNNQPDAMTFGAIDSALVGLGEARYLPFMFSGIACVAFEIVWGGGSRRDTPVNVVKGTYCDPAVAELPVFDILATLNAIGVRGVYAPP